MKRHFYTLFILISLSSFLNAQFVSVESTLPPGIKWKQIKTDTVRVIYPEGLYDQAARIASTIHYMNDNNAKSLGDKVRKLDVFLLNSTVISNGYVSAPPFHSKFYTQGPENAFAGTTDWLDLLTIHEYRHAMQYSNAVNGWTKILYFLLGEPLLAGASHLAAPPWFWEGDAVVQETALSSSGRGRVPSFSAHINSIADQKKLYSYEKMVGGSYKDIIPDHYTLGYELNSFGRNVFGNDFWVGIYKDATAYKSIFWPFSTAIKRRTGKRTKGLYKAMMQNKKQESQSIEATNASKFTFPSSNPGEYSFPRFRNETEMVVMEESFNKEAWIVSLDPEGNTKRILPVGFNAGVFDAQDSLIVWTEIKTHPRWQDVSYSNLYTHNLNTEKTQKLSNKKRYFSPKLSPDNARILSVNTTDKMEYSLHLLNAKSGKIKEQYSFNPGIQIGHFCWLNEKSIAVVLKKPNSNGLFLLDLEENTLKELIPYQYDLIEYLSYHDNKIYFHSNEGNQQNRLKTYNIVNEEIHTLDIQTPYALEMPVVSENGTLAYVEIMHNAKNLAVLKKQDLRIKIQGDRIQEKSYHDKMIDFISQAEGGDITKEIPKRDYKSKRYRSGLSKLRLHTWMLQPSPPNYSISFQANDPLSTVGFVLEPGYNTNEKVFLTNAKLTYAKYYPKFELGFSKFSQKSDSITIEGHRIGVDWNEHSINASVHIPLSFTKRNYYYSFNPLVSIQQVTRSDYLNIDRKSYHILNLEWRNSAIRKKGYRNITPKYSYSSSLAYRNVFSRINNINLSGKLNLYFPGLSSNHNTILNLDFRYQDVNDQYLFFDTHPYAGDTYANISSDWITSLKFNYTFPLWYPDIAIGPFAFIKRFRANVYYDFDYYGNSSFEEIEQVHVAGIDLIMDAKYLRLLEAPFGIGMNIRKDQNGYSFTPLRFVFDVH